MTVQIVWLLIVMGASNGAVIGKFADEAACQQTRQAAIAQITTFYRSQSACVRAELVKETK